MNDGIDRRSTGLLEISIYGLFTMHFSELLMSCKHLATLSVIMNAVETPVSIVTKYYQTILLK